jgi:hypothetical protein
MHALVDADIIVFRCGLAAERKVWHLAWEPIDGGFAQTRSFEYKKEANTHLNKVLPGEYSREEGVDYKLWPEVDLQPLSHALQNVKTMMARILEAIDCTDFDVEMFLSPGSGGTFRHRLAKTKPYKGNRDRSHRPTYEQDIRDYIKKTWNTVEAVDEEADDLLAIAQTAYGPDDSVIVSIDKDLDQVPGYKYNFLHEIRYYITEAQAQHNLMVQIMTGDSTDNIPGIPKVGPAKAEAALHGLTTYDEMLDAVARMYQVRSGKEDWEGYMNEQAALVYMRRTPGEIWKYEPSEQELGSDWGQEEVSLYDD